MSRRAGVGRRPKFYLLVNFFFFYEFLCYFSLQWMALLFGRDEEEDQ